MKFIHSSDWHLGRQLHGESLIEQQRLALQQIAQLAVEHQVDALVIAGDIYDRSIPPAAAVTLLSDFLDEMIAEHQIPVLLTAGNHDSAERLGFAANQMKRSGLHIVGSLTAELTPILLQGKSGAAWFYPISYAEPTAVRHLLDDDSITSHEQAMAAMLAQVAAHSSEGLPKVVVAHCFLDGSSESESERPLSVGGADRISPALFTPFDYAALGHLHGPQYRAAEHVRYSGSPLKYSFSEATQRKSVTLVELKPSQPAVITLLPITAARDVRIIEGSLAELLERAKDDPHADDYLMVRLSDTHALLDPMGKLRSRYPNVLHLERTGLMTQQQDRDIGRERIKKGELEMFSDFFSQVAGELLTEAQQQHLHGLIDELHQGEDA
ncbi:exonuclease SbcCD subunit D [Shewanella avicenniae]|uniref:Nuclease SbcCD subunit D n=1 Tax=Shewanella avicenniae TaxID=2814294 RepID=A0ABX7QNL9_9GAMM|nr:exonuclease SbcCD subunit D [Shewanella avicenniae]QSX32345.1 exonuclease SbcCD subunit D [Shewanella avicenniae]